MVTIKNDGDQYLNSLNAYSIDELYEAGEVNIVLFEDDHGQIYFTNRVIEYIRDREESEAEAHD